VDHVRVNLLGSSVSTHGPGAPTPGSGTPLANRCKQCECLNEWRLAPFGSFSRRNSSEIAAEPIQRFWAANSRSGSGVSVLYKPTVTLSRSAPACYPTCWLIQIASVSAERDCVPLNSNLRRFAE
jgi:hypothetical protein